MRQGHEAQFVDDQEIKLRLQIEQPSFSPVLHQPVDQGGGSGEFHRDSTLAVRVSASGQNSAFHSSESGSLIRYGEGSHS